MHAIAVIPTYNERDNLTELVGKIHKHVSGLHILVVDDNSPDGTGTVAEELHKKYPQSVFVLHRPRKEGLGRAYIDGFAFALHRQYEIVLQMDADLSHDPSYLPNFLDQIRSYDLVMGSRYLSGISVVNWDFKRLLLSKMASAYVRLVTRMPFSDATTGYKCWRRETLEAIRFDEAISNGYLFQIEMTYKTYKRGLKLREIPIIFVDRSNGRSKMNWNIISEAVWGVLKLRFNYSLRSFSKSWKPVPKTT
jgi:dolichol-phosphate mannosyltransferase